MDFTTQPKPIQEKWLEQRGWQRSETSKDIWIDPDLRVPLYLTMAVKKAMTECRLPADMELRVEELPPKQRPTVVANPPPSKPPV